MQHARKTKTQIVKQFLLDRINSQRIPLGERLPTEEQLVAQFAVSRTTVRRALDQLSFDGFIERCPGRGTFQRVPTRETKRGDRSMLVGVWFNLPRGSLYAPIFDAIRQELLYWDYHAILQGGLQNGDELRGVETLMRKGLDGYIVSPSSNPADDHLVLGRMLREGAAVVLIDKHVGDYVANLVAVNHQLGAQVLVEHLLQLGHRRIGFIGYHGVWSVEERYRAYQLITQRHGIEPDGAWVELTPQVYSDLGKAAAARMLALPPDRRPTAIFAVNDPIAETVVAEARARGLKIPGDLSVVGFDNATLHQSEPWLTTYAQPKELIGQCAAQLLMTLVRDRPTHVQTILLQGELLVQGSTAPPNC
jgi:DNA-binding LacI/PurR family transcriptional regulator